MPIVAEALAPLCPTLEHVVVIDAPWPDLASLAPHPARLWIATLSAGTPEQHAMVQDAVNRWWWPSLMMFGPSDKDSPNSAELMRWRVKRNTNDTLRQRFVDLTVPQARAVGLTLPDPDLRHNDETGHWEFGEIDWKEFQEVISGNGPCNRERIAARRKAHDDGAWVREAAEAYAAKRAAVEAA